MGCVRLSVTTGDHYKTDDYEKAIAAAVLKKLGITKLDINF